MTEPCKCDELHEHIEELTTQVQVLEVAVDHWRFLYNQVDTLYREAQKNDRQDIDRPSSAVRRRARGRHLEGDPMNREEWIQLGIEKQWCTGIRCAHHQGASDWEERYEKNPDDWDDICWFVLELKDYD